MIRKVFRQAVWDWRIILLIGFLISLGAAQLWPRGGNLVWSVSRGPKLKEFVVGWPMTNAEIVERTDRKGQTSSSITYRQGYIAINIVVSLSLTLATMVVIYGRNLCVKRFSLRDIAKLIFCASLLLVGWQNQYDLFFRLYERTGDGFNLTNGLNSLPWFLNLPLWMMLFFVFWVVGGVLFNPKRRRTNRNEEQE